MPFAARQVSGGAWTQQALPEPAGAVGDGAGAVSCTTASFCMAIGTGPGWITESWERQHLDRPHGAGIPLAGHE